MSSTKKTVIDKSTSKLITTFYLKSLFVYSDVCDFSSVNGLQEPLLSVIQSDPSYGWNDKFFPVYYIRSCSRYLTPFTTTKVMCIHVHCKTDPVSLFLYTGICYISNIHFIFNSLINTILRIFYISVSVGSIFMESFN